MINNGPIPPIMYCQPSTFSDLVCPLLRVFRRVEGIGEIQPLSCGLSLYIVCIESGCLSGLGMGLGI